jgi:hypothetical protein
MSYFKRLWNAALRIIGFFICLFARFRQERATRVSNEREKKVGKLIEVAAACAETRNFKCLPTGLQDRLFFVPPNGDYVQKVRNCTERWASKHISEVYYWYDSYMKRESDIPSSGLRIIAA